MDEIYIKVKGKWVYLYRAIDKEGKILDCMLSMRRDKAAARLFFRRAIEANGLPTGIMINKSGANLAGIEVAHMIQKQQFQTNHPSPFKQFAVQA